MNKTKGKIIGKFYAITYDNQIYEFNINENSLIYCDKISKENGITLLIINPNFKACIEKNNVISCDMIAKENNNQTTNHFIGCYLIENNLLEELIRKKRIIYTTKIGKLYGLNLEYADDKREQNNTLKRIKRINNQTNLKLTHSILIK